MNAISSEELSPKHLQQWNDTTSMMAWVAPGFRHLWYKLLSEANLNGRSEYVAVMTKDIPVAATDGKNVLINPDTFFKLSLRERVFIGAHEVVHNVYGDVDLLHRCRAAECVPMHDGSSLPFDSDTFQRAMDYRINALLVDSKIGTMPKEGCISDKYGADMSVLDIYQSEYKKKPKDCDGSGGFDKLLPPGSTAGQTPQQGAQNKQQWAVEVAAAQTIEQVRSQGRMAAGLKRLFEEILEPEVHWTDHIKATISRKVGSGCYNWYRGDRRYLGQDIYFPSQSGFGCGWIVCWGDTSGSRSDVEVASSLAECSGIIEELRPKRLTVLWCDAKIDYVDEIENAADLAHIRARGTSGGGGTSCDPVFEWIEQNSYEPPELFIGFTDGYVSFPANPPKYPVIWASSTDNKYPWGDVVRVLQRAKI